MSIRERLLFLINLARLHYQLKLCRVASDLRLYQRENNERNRHRDEREEYLPQEYAAARLVRYRHGVGHDIERGCNRRIKRVKQEQCRKHLNEQCRLRSPERPSYPGQHEYQRLEERAVSDIRYSAPEL